jgi:hypothetical protein
VKAGVTLTIAAGTTVRLNPGVILFIDGTLSAQGSSANLIRFQNEGTVAWGMVYFTSTSQNSVMQYCQLDNGGIRVDTNSLTVSFCKVTGGGLWLDANGNVSVTNCTFDAGTLQSSWGIYLWQSGGSLLMTNCIIRNYFVGVSCQGTGSISLTTCSVINSINTGVQNLGTLSITNSNLFGGTYSYVNMASANQTATGNWWNTTNTATIDALILDQNDTASYGLVDYSGFLSAAVTVTGCGW